MAKTYHWKEVSLGIHENYEWWYENKAKPIIQKSMTKLAKAVEDEALRILHDSRTTI